MPRQIGEMKKQQKFRLLLSWAGVKLSLAEKS
jgi:hypothetical protein